MITYQEWQENRIKRRDAEIDALWNGLRDVLNAQSIQDARKLAQTALDKIDPFLAREVVQAHEEARKAS